MWMIYTPSWRTARPDQDQLPRRWNFSSRKKEKWGFAINFSKCTIPGDSRSHYGEKNILVLNHSSLFVIGAMRQLIRGFISCCFWIVTEPSGKHLGPMVSRGGQGQLKRLRWQEALPSPCFWWMHLFQRLHLLGLPFKLPLAWLSSLYFPWARCPFHKLPRSWKT